MSTRRVITKYPNRRLYDTGESRYITLHDIRRLVLEGCEFIVVDKKSGDDLTRSVLLQIISEQEQNGAAVLTEALLAHIIRCSGTVDAQSLAGRLEQMLQQLVAPTQNLPADPGMPSQSKNTLTSGP